MRPTRIANHTHAFSPPKDWDAETAGHCGTLFARAEVVDGVAYMRSAWETEHHEAGLFLAGAKMVLGIAGQGHPVVHIALAQLPEDFEPVLTARHIIGPSGQRAVRVEMTFAHDGGRRAFSEILLAGCSFPAAVAKGAELILELADKEGWLAVPAPKDDA